MRFVLLIYYLLVFLPSFGKGVLCLTFDDRNFDSWTNAIPVFREYNAHVSFFPFGVLGDHERRCLIALSKAGHTIGTHTVGHVDVPVAMKSWWERICFYRRHCKPHVNELGELGIQVRSFAYPYGNHYNETDRRLGRWFTHLRGVAHRGYATNGVSIVRLDDVFFPASNVHTRLYLPGVGVGDYYHSDVSDLKKGIERIARNDEVLVLFSHAIMSDVTRNSSIDIRMGELVELLRAAKDRCVAVKGFDEL